MGGGWRCAAVAEYLAQARAALMAADPVAWTGPAAAAYHATLGELLASLTALRHATGETHTAVRRHEAAVATVRLAAPS